MTRIYVWIVDHDDGKVEQMHYCMNQAQYGDRDARQFVQIDVVIQWQVRGQPTTPEVSQ